MKLNLKDNKAITLISLVVTIIVLLILAGISISMLAGDNSILQKATEAKTNSDNAQAREELQLAISGAGVDYHSGKVQNSSQTLRDYIFSNDGQTSINNELPENATFNSSSNEITYKRITFAVASDGTLSISTPQVFDDLPDDFWIADNGTAYINTKYIDMTNATEVEKGSYGAYGASSTTKAGTCQYTKLTVPASINGETITKFNVDNVSNITALDIQDGITELANLKTIVDNLEIVKKPRSLVIPKFQTGNYVNYRNSGSTACTRYRVLYDTNSQYGWVEIISENPLASVGLGSSDEKVTASDFNYTGTGTMGNNVKKAAASYNRAVTTLNEATQKYITDLADRARCVGSNPLNPEDVAENTYTNGYEYMETYSWNNKFKATDENYLTDKNQLEAIGAMQSSGSYWLASRYIDLVGSSYTQFDIRYVNIFYNHYLYGQGVWNELYQKELFTIWSTGSSRNLGQYCGVRPVIRLKSSTQLAGGKGTTYEPYELGRYTVIEK